MPIPERPLVLKHRTSICEHALMIYQSRPSGTFLLSSFAAPADDEGKSQRHLQAGSTATRA
jgi:hypothetical protein